MIDFDDMKRRQEEGLKLVDSLQEDELMILRHYCSLSTEALIKMGAQRKSSTDQVVINALKNGIALGLRLQVVDGEIQGRL
ncbi:hypothetical protein KKE60_05380 [Patescibacteria group bacterium]|nr:hypothetical protein [Patescibacteria group bacterium]